VVFFIDIPNDVEKCVLSVGTRIKNARTSEKKILQNYRNFAKNREIYTETVKKVGFFSVLAYANFDNARV
jgi:hypothetical protein